MGLGFSMYMGISDGVDVVSQFDKFLDDRYFLPKTLLRFASFMNNSVKKAIFICSIYDNVFYSTNCVFGGF